MTTGSLSLPELELRAYVELGSGPDVTDRWYLRHRAGTAVGLAGLSALVLAMGVTLAVIEAKAAKNEPVSIA